MKLDHEITESTPLTLAAGLHERRVGDKVFVLDAQTFEVSYFIVNQIHQGAQLFIGQWGISNHLSQLRA